MAESNTAPVAETPPDDDQFTDSRLVDQGIIDDGEIQDVSGGDAAVDEGGAETSGQAEGGDTATAASAASTTAEPWFHRFGDEFKGLDESTARERIANRYEQVRQQAAESQRQAQVLAWQQHEQNRQWQAQQQAAQQQAQQPQKKAWEPPPFDPNWLNLVHKDEQGNLVANPGAMPDLPQKVLAYAQWKQEQEHKFWQNPHEFMLQGMLDPINQVVQLRVNDALGQYQRVQQARAFDEKNQALLYDVPPSGNFPGQISQIGQQILARADQLQALGFRDRPAACEYALQEMYLQAQAQQSQMAAQQAAAPAAAASRNQQIKTDFNRRAAQSKAPVAPASSRGRPAPAGGKSYKQGFGKSLKENFAKAGIVDQDEPVAV